MSNLATIAEKLGITEEELKRLQEEAQTKK